MEPQGVEELAGAVESQEASVLLTVGTMKGAWLFAGDPERGKWRWSGPHFRGEQVYAIRFDGRGGRRRLLAGTEHGHWGRWCGARTTWGAPGVSRPRGTSGSRRGPTPPWPGCGSSSRPPTTGRARCGPGSSRRRCSGPTTAGRRSSWSRASGTIPTGHAGSRAAAGCACTRSCPTRPIRPDVDRHLHRRGVPHRGRRPELAGPQRRRPGGVPARQVPRVRPVRAQGRPGRRTAGPPVPPEPLGPVPQRRWGRPLGGHGQRGAERLRLPHGRPPSDPDTAWIIPLDSDQFRCTPDGQARVYRTWTPATPGSR